MLFDSFCEVFSAAIAAGWILVLSPLIIGE